MIGPPAEELRAATIPVVSDIDAIAARPDVIHGHHALENGGLYAALWHEQSLGAARSA